MGNSNSVVKTLLYSQIFDYPLTKDQIWHFLISDKNISYQDFLEQLNHNKQIKREKNYYFISGNKDLVGKRLGRQKESCFKLQKAKRIIARLAVIQTICFIGISGSLALLNTRKNDDIDIFVITKTDTLWLTRFLIVLLLKILGVHRRRESKNVSDKICLNMLLEEHALSQDHNLYTAHEIVQMMPIFERHNAYARFLAANQWVKNFMPNITIPQDLKSEFSQKNQTGYFIKLINLFAKKLQLWYIEKNRTREKVSDHFAAFHPTDYKEKTLNIFDELIRENNI